MVFLCITSSCLRYPCIAGLGGIDFARRYQHLEWRLDVEIARRTVAQDATPTFMLRLDTSQSSAVGSEPRSSHMSADYASLKHLQAQLEAAVREEQSVHARRFQRYIQ